MLPQETEINFRYTDYNYNLAKSSNKTGKTNHEPAACTEDFCNVMVICHCQCNTANVNLKLTFMLWQRNG